MDNNKVKDIIISEGRLPLWSKMLGWICLVAGTVLCYRTYIQSDFASLILIGLLTIDFVFMLWMVIYIKFDVAGRRFKKEYTVGILRLGIWRKLPQIDYISVFKQLGSSDEGESLFIRYDVNVWYNDTKHFTIYTHPDKGQSYSMAMRLAVKLNVDMLDATIPNDFKWVELPVKDIPV